jgi:hypothetical protein
MGRMLGLNCRTDFEIPAMRNALSEPFASETESLSPCPSTPLIRTESGIARSRREPPLHERAERITDRLRLSVTIELKKCDEIKNRRKLSDGRWHLRSRVTAPISYCTAFP